MINKAKKAEMLQNLQERLKKSSAVFVLTFRGIKVSEVNEIRRLLKEKGGEYRIVKNTLIRIGTKETPFREVMNYVEGPTALVFSYQDPVEIAKTLKDFIKKVQTLEIKGFVMEGKGYEAKRIDELVALPSREILLAQVLGTLQAPVANFVGVLSAILRNFLYVLKAIEEKKREVGN